MEIKICKKVCINCHSFGDCYNHNELDFEKDWNRGYVFCKDTKRAGYFYRNHKSAIKHCDRKFEHLVMEQTGELI